MNFNRFIPFQAMSLAGELLRRIMNVSCGDQKCSEFNCGHYGTKMESEVKRYILPVHRNGRGQTGKFRSPNIFWPALESILPLYTIYLKTKCADGFADRLRLGP